MRERCSSPRVNGRKLEACPSLGRRSGEGGAELFEGGDFLLGSDPGNDVTGETAGQRGSVWCDTNGIDHVSNDGCKGIAVVETKGSHAVAAAAQVHGLLQEHGRLMPAFPQLHRRLVAVGRRTVKGVLGRTESRVLSGDKSPRIGGQPRTAGIVHRSGFLFGFLFGLCQFSNSSAFQKALSGFGVDRFSGEAVLNGECVRHHTFENGIFQQFGVDLGFHAGSLQEIVAGGNALVPGHPGRGRRVSIG